jgi:hypothetical protein
MQFRVFLILLLLGSTGVFSQELEDVDPTFGGLKPLPPLSAGQKKIMDNLKLDLKGLHEDIQKRLVFLSQEKKFHDGKYVQSSVAREQFQYPTKKRSIVNHQFILNVTGGDKSHTLKDIEIWTRKSITTRHLEYEDTKIMRVNQPVGSDDWNSMKISIRKITPEGISSEVFSVEEIYEPTQRVMIAIMYRNKLREIISSIDRYVEAKGRGLTEDIRFINNEMNTSGQYQELE